MNKSIHKLIDEQVKKWEMGKKDSLPTASSIQVVTVSRECGSKGHEVASQLCRKIGFDLFHNEILDTMVDVSHNSRVLLETLDERGMNIVDDLVSDFVNQHHLWPDEYSKLLFKILTTVAKHGRAVILGRGANCVLKGEGTLRVRIVAPPSIRQERIQFEKDLNPEDARRLMTSTDANRTAFVKRYFNSDSKDASNYDIVLNTSSLSVDKAVEMIQCAIN